MLDSNSSLNLFSLRRPVWRSTNLSLNQKAVFLLMHAFSQILQARVSSLRYSAGLMLAS